ncbi:MAG: type IX secretion system membrane protein PorP/SprF [Dysgonamonadaceae bacterium]|jgi:type IX secretion system PorP/SprF family membrane protein|nr:type IX secretion system membrane protein PorP/SprF [Dysgonamonadaceae bacterium]
MKRLFFIIIAGLSVAFTAVAQYDAQLSNYWTATGYFNPANAGRSENLETMVLYRQQWLGIDGAPGTTLITADMPLSLLGRTHGVGAVLFSERIGLFEHSIVSGQFAYKKNRGKGTFSAGLQIGYIAETFKGSKIDPKDINDDYHQLVDAGIPTSDVTGSGIDAAFGLMFYKPEWYVGLSATHLLGPKLILGENYVMEIPRAYYLTAGYNIQLKNPLLELRPSLLVKTTEMGPAVKGDSITGDVVKAMMTMTQLDLSVRMIYNKTYWGGFGWRKGDAAVLMLGGKFSMVEAGYAYDFPISTILKGSTGSHEIFLKFVVNLDKKKGKKNKHKSIRIL